MIQFLYNSRNRKLIYSNKEEITGGLKFRVEAAKGGEALQKGVKKHLRVMQMFFELTVIRVSWVET